MTEPAKRPRGGETWRRTVDGVEVAVDWRRACNPMGGVRSLERKTWSSLVHWETKVPFQVGTAHESDFIRWHEFVKRGPSENWGTLIGRVLDPALQTHAVRDAVVDCGLAVLSLVTREEERVRYLDALDALAELQEGIPDNEFERWQQADRLRAGIPALESLSDAGRGLKAALDNAQTIAKETQ